MRAATYDGLPSKHRWSERFQIGTRWDNSPTTSPTRCLKLCGRIDSFLSPGIRINSDVLAQMEFAGMAVTKLSLTTGSINDNFEVWKRGLLDLTASTAVEVKEKVRFTFDRHNWSYRLGEHSRGYVYDGKNLIFRVTTLAKRRLFCNNFPMVNNREC